MTSYTLLCRLSAGLLVTSLALVGCDSDDDGDSGGAMGGAGGGAMGGAGGEEGKNCTAESFFTQQAGNSTDDPMLDGYMPAAGSPLMGAGSTPADAFFTSVDYIGAFGAEDWTAGWTIGLDTDTDNPAMSTFAKGAAEGDCPAGTEPFSGSETVCFLTGTITEDVTLTAGKDYYLSGPVFVGDGDSTNTLTIEPGVVVLGGSDPASPGTLIIAQNAKLMADGTAEAPIVFTSELNAGERTRGNWGGIIINGNAPINICEDGVCTAQGEGDTGTYGGDDPADNSGTLRYVRVEYAGIQFSEENELNGIAFQGVGSGTTVEYIQVHMNADDGVEFFGGNVNAKYIVLTGIGDDSLDWTFGWQGMAQFVVARQYTDGGDQGIEADNYDENNDATPRSNPTLSNLTLIGHGDSDIGMLLREGTAASISNVVVTGFGEACLSIDQDATFELACAEDGSVTGELTVTNTYLSGCGASFK